MLMLVCHIVSVIGLSSCLCCCQFVVLRVLLLVHCVLVFLVHPITNVANFLHC